MDFHLDMVQFGKWQKKSGALEVTVLTTRLFNLYDILLSVNNGFFDSCNDIHTSKLIIVAVLMLLASKSQVLK